MSDKKESGKNPSTKQSVKCSVPIEIFLKIKEKQQRLELLKKQRSLLDKMKEERNKSFTAIDKPETTNTVPKNDDKPNIGDVGDLNEERPIPAPVVAPEPKLLPCRPCKARPQRPKRLRRLPHVGQPPHTRTRGPHRPHYDDNNNTPMQQNNMMIGGNLPVAPVYHNVPQNPMGGPRFH